MIYQAFISYSHAADGKLAPALQKALGRFGRAWYQRSAIRIFRDETNLSVSPGLWTSIEKALGESDYFLLLCSPEASESKWVRREVDYWVSHSTPQKLLIVLTDGEILWSADAGDFDWERTTLPKNLSKVFAEEPLWADMRWARTSEHLSLQNPRFRDQTADILSSLTGRAKDDLIGADVRIQRRARRLAWSASALLFVLLVVAVIAAFLAIRERDTAIAQKKIAVAQEKIAVGRQLGAQAELTRTLQGRLIDRSVLLALESARRVTSIETDQALRNGLMLLGEPVMKIPHTGNLKAIAISPNGDQFALVDEYDKTATINRVSTRAALATLAHDDWITSVAFSPDGKLLATGSWDQTLRLWDTVTFKELLRVPHKGNVLDVAFSRDGRFLASGSGPHGLDAKQEGWVRVWAVGPAAPVTLREVTNIHLEGDAFSIAFDHEARHIAATYFGTVRVFRIRGGREEWHVEAPGGEDASVEGLAFSPDGKYLAFAVFHGYAYVYDFKTRQLVGTFGGHGDDTRRVAFTPDGAHLVTGDSDDTIRVWNLGNRGEIRRIGARGPFVIGAGCPQIMAPSEGGITFWNWSSEPVIRTIPHPTTLLQCVLSQNSRRLTALDTEGILWFSDPIAGTPLGKLEHQEEDSPLALSPDARLLAVARDSAVTIQAAEEAKRVYATLLHPRDGNLSPPPEASQPFIQRAEFSPDGSHLATVTTDGTIRIWNTTTWTLDRTLRMEGAIENIQFSGNSHRLLVYASRRRPERGKGVLRIIAVWEVETDTRLAELELTGNVSEPRGIKTAISKSGEYFSAALPAWNDKAPAILLLWTVAGSRQVGRITLPANILSLSFSPDESSLAAGLEDSTARLWDVRTTEELRSFTHEGRVRDVQFDPAGKYLVTASSDKTSRVWEVASGHEVAQMVQDDDLVAAQFSPDGKYVLNETIGAAISFWPWRTSDLVTEACRRLSRNLSVDEWRTYLPGEPYSKTCPNLP